MFFYAFFTKISYKNNINKRNCAQREKIIEKSAKYDKIK